MLQEIYYNTLVGHQLTAQSTTILALARSYHRSDFCTKSLPVRIEENQFALRCTVGSCWQLLEGYNSYVACRNCIGLLLSSDVYRWTKLHNWVRPTTLKSLLIRNVIFLALC